jgi:hypothetical protein
MAENWSGKNTNNLQRSEVSIQAARHPRARAGRGREAASCHRGPRCQGSVKTAWVGRLVNVLALIFSSVRLMRAARNACSVLSGS